MTEFFSPTVVLCSVAWAGGALTTMAFAINRPLISIGLLLGWPLLDVLLAHHLFPGQ